MTPSILLCTVGTSLLNAANFGGQRTAGETTDWKAVAAALNERLNRWLNR